MAKKKMTKKQAKKPAKKISKAPAKKAAKKTIKKPVKKMTPKPSPKGPAAKAKPVLTAKAAAKKINWGQFLTPLDDRLVIEVKAADKMTPGGLYIPDTAALTGNYKGLVLAVGRGHKNKKGQIRPMDVKPGDQVLFGQHSGSNMTMDGSEVRILRESEILGIVESK